MEPTLLNGDLSVMYANDSYEVGDIVAFDIPEGGTVIHRVETATPDGYTFRGDNRETSDPWQLDVPAIRGRQLIRVPNFQMFVSVIGRPEVTAGLVFGLIILFRSGVSETKREEEPSLAS